MIILNDILIDTVAKKFFDILQSKDVTYFLGGSRRFGYKMMGSDYDIFIMNKPNLDELLTRIGFVECSNRKYASKSKTYTYNNLIHASIILDGNEFDTIFEDHERVEKFINSHKFMIANCKLLKKYISGSDLYNTLLQYSYE